MKVYRSRRGWICGVCKGVEESMGWPAKYTRILLILAAVVFRPWYVLAAYGLAALLLPVKQPGESENRGFKENFEDLRDDVRKTASREYREFLRFASGRSREKKEGPTGRPD